MSHVRKLSSMVVFCAAMALAGCAGESSTESADAGHEGHDHAAETATAPPSPELKPLVAESGAPSQFVGVAKARETAADGSDVVVVGRLKDFVAGKAAFTMVDGAIPSCLEDDSECDTPWDYCCIAPAKIAANSATVKLIGEDGNLLDGNLQGVNSIDHLSTVVVTGKAQKDETGNLTIAANKVYLQ